MFNKCINVVDREGKINLFGFVNNKKYKKEGQGQIQIAKHMSMQIAS